MIDHLILISHKYHIQDFWQLIQYFYFKLEKIPKLRRHWNIYIAVPWHHIIVSNGANQGAVAKPPRYIVNCGEVNPKFHQVEQFRMLIRYTTILCAIQIEVFLVGEIRVEVPQYRWCHVVVIIHRSIEYHQGMWWIIFWDHDFIRKIERNANQRLYRDT